MNKIYIGIDPGVKTGVAIIENGKYTNIATMGILEAIELLTTLSSTNDIEVTIENPNKRKWFGNTGREKLQGAGSIKRDYSIWEDFLTKAKIKFTPIAPQSVGNQFDNDVIFKSATGWQKRTSNHARDAAKMIFKYMR